MKHPRWTPNLEKKFRSRQWKLFFAIGYYCLHIILFGPNLIIRLRFDVLPTTEISVISFHISVGNETSNQSLLKLIMKTGLIANWYNYVSNLMCCLSCFIVYACLCWGWKNGGMWCYCFTKELISICSWWLRRGPDLFVKWWCLFRHFWWQEFLIWWSQRLCI